MAIKQDAKKKIHESDRLINAFNFLRLLGVIENMTDLAAKMKFSTTHVSSALQPGKEVSEYLLLKFEKMFLLPRGLRIDDFEDMEEFLDMKDGGKRGSVESLIVTKVTRVEAMGKTILDVLDEIKKEITELKKENKALTQRLNAKK